MGKMGSMKSFDQRHLKKLLLFFPFFSFFLFLPCAFADEAVARKEWPSYLGDAHRTHYSALKQINTQNVTRLREAWRYNSGGEAQIQTNPLMIDGVLYGVSAERRIFALEADTGKELWTFKTPFEEGPGSVIRGLAWWEKGKDRRILVGIGHYLFALDAATGLPIQSFGVDGVVDMSKAYDRDVSKLSLVCTSPGTVFKDLIIMPMRVNEAHPAAPGDIIAFNVLTGERAWVFHTIPRPGEPGAETWPADALAEAGGANCWSGMSLDEKRGILYVPTGSAAFDFYGGDRKGANLYANCLLALEAATGKLVWHYQTVHHDLWDRDLPAPPTLVTVKHEGKRRDAVAQITKSGFVFLLDRDTGEPLFPVEEVPVAPSEVPGEAAWPTQPIPTKPPAFARQVFTEDMVTERTPEAKAQVLERLRRAKTGQQFIPPSLEGTVIFPGFDGGGEWGGAAFDPKSGLLYVNASEMPWILTMYETTGLGEGPGTMGARIYAQNCIFCHGPELKGDPLQEFPPLRDLKKKYTPDQMKAIIHQGRERMPSFQHLNDGEIQAVVDLLYELEGRDLELVNQAAAAEAATANPDAVRTFAHTGYNRFVDPEGCPAVKPPWGTLNAIDLNTGEIAWKVALGQNPELPDEAYRNAGTETYGGPIVTAGGLVFIAGTKDACIRAFDKQTGKELWKAELPVPGYATPATYSIKGRQYVVVAAGGGKIGSKAGDAYVAFRLGE